MTNTSGKICLQSNIICHEARVKPATTAYYVADLIPFLSYVIFFKKYVFHSQSNNIRNISVY